jgi:hypothetical protein
MHWAIPLLLMMTPAGAAMVMGSESDHITCGIPVMGAMLYFPVAVNWTCLLVKFWAIADCGVTVMLCSCRTMDEFTMCPSLHALIARKIRKRAATMGTGGRRILASN